MNTRLFGVVFAIGSLIVIFNGLLRSGDSGDMPQDILSNVVYVLWGISGICGIIGLIRLNALGSNAVARAFGFLPVLGFASFIVSDSLSLFGFLNMEGSLYGTIISIGWITLLVGMLIVGILTIAAKRWTGWQRFVPILTVVMVPVGFGVGQLVGNQEVGGVLANITWVLLGLVIANAEKMRLFAADATVA